MTTPEIQIRRADSTHEEAIWSIMHEVISGGDTYAFAPDTPRQEMLRYWFAEGSVSFVALIGGEVAGTYAIRSNQPGLGSHIANGAFMTAARFRKNGVGRAMGLHALEAARQAGYRAMQFNFVVKSNTAAVALWIDLGFQIIGEIPEAYRHVRNGYANIYIMYRSLADQ